MNVLSYNLRGSGSYIKRKILCRLIKDQCFDVCFLQETKIQVVTEVDIFELWGSKEVEWTCKGEEGRSGGIILMWKACVFQPLFSFSGEGFVGKGILSI